MNTTASSPPFGPVLARLRQLLDAAPSGGGPDPGPEPEGEPLVVLAHWARRDGLRLEPFAAPPSVALRSAHERRPLLTLAADGGPLLLTGRAGALVRVEDAEGRREWLDASRLAARLGLAHDGVEHTWLATDDPARCAPAVRAASPWLEILHLLRGDGPDLLAIGMYAVGVGVLSLALPLAVQALVNTVAFGTLLQPIVVLSLLLAAGLVFAAALRALQAWVVELVQRRLFVRLVSALAERLPRVHVRAFERAHGPELVNRFFDVFLAQKALSALLLGGVEAILTVVVGLVVLAFYHPWLLAFGLVILAGAAAVFAGLGRGATATTIAESKAKYAVAGWLEEMARHLFALKLAGGAEQARAHLDRLAADWLRARGAHYQVVFRQLLGALGLQVVISASLLGLGGWLVIERQLTIGQLVAAELIVGAVVASLIKLGGKLESAYDLVAAADKLGVLLSLPLEREDGEEPAPSSGAASLELRGVTSADGAVRGLSLAAPAGALLAVSAPEAEGNALVELLFGMREPAEGTVLLDGHDVRDLRLAWLRRRVVVVRGPEVLPGTVADNVRAAARAASATEVWEALRDVGLGEQVRSLPDGLRTLLATDGAPLGGLLALRLTLARAIAARPALLVLDGVLDALPAAERGALLTRVSRDRTVVVVTRDPSLAASCALRVELEGGSR